MLTLQEYYDKYHISLSKQQESAMLRDKGETLLLAVPGSGKTTVIIARTGYLIFCKGVKPKQILTITYSKAAALEMEERFRAKFEADTEIPKFSTIHSLCVSVLRNAKQLHSCSIPKLEPNGNRIIQHCLYEDTDIWPSEFLVKKLALLLTNARNKMLSGAEIRTIRVRELQNEYRGMTFEHFYNLYEKYKARNRIMDFDDQLTMAYDFLLEFPDIRRQYQNAYPYIGVDESQDTSLIQYEIIHLLANGGKALFVVGDDDQSIYGFRGADPSNILSFQSFYPSAEVLYMETNYRSCPEIVSAADRFIDINNARYKKSACASRSDPGEIITTIRDTETGVFSDLRRRIQAASGSAGTLAVIARNNASLLPVVDILERNKVITRRRDSFDSVFHYPAVAGLLSALTLAVEPWNTEAFRGCRTLLKLYISNQMMSDIESYLASSETPIQEQNVIAVAKELFASKNHVVSAIEKAEKALRLAAMQSPRLAIRTILTRYGKGIEGCTEYLDGGRLTPAAIYLGAVSCVADAYKDIQPFLTAIRKYAAGGDFRGVPSNITLTTIHSAKGMEFDDVILLDAIEGILPQDEMPTETDDVEEEARLFYVAVTRARNRVEFLVPRNLYGIPVRPSKFIARLTSPGPKTSASAQKPATASSAPAAFSIGCRVSHATFGSGTVTLIKGDVLTIRFDETGERRVLSSFCRPS